VRVLSAVKTTTEAGEMAKELQFPMDEYAMRIDRVRRLMHRDGIALLLIGTGPNLTYFTGYPSPVKSASRPFVFLLPSEGAPTLLAQDGRTFEARRYSWVEDLRTYAPLAHLPIGLIVDVLRQKGLVKGTVGIERGNEMEPNYPAWELPQVSEALPGIAFADVSELLWELRMVKSARELECMGRACAITSHAFAQCLPQIRAGMTEIDVGRLFALTMMAGGGSEPRLNMTSGRGNYDLATKGPSARVLQPGDLIRIDTGCGVGGYQSDFSRAAVVGHATAAQRRGIDIVNRATAAGVAVIRAGVGVAQVAQACDRVLGAAGLPITSSISGLAGRAGHGIGLGVPEMPGVGKDDPTILQPGMVIAIEPGVATEDGTFHQEQNVVVTEDGCTVLSDVPVDLVETAT